MISPPGSLRPIYEQILAHYHVRRGLPAPAVQRAVEKIRPEGAVRNADHTGFGTLLYACTADDSERVPPAVPPAALHAIALENAIDVEWLEARKSDSPSLERGGTVERVNSRRGSWRDQRVLPGRRYSYRFSTPGHARFRAASISIVAGLPAGWASVKLGQPSVIGDVQFVDNVVTLSAAGKGLLQAMDEGQFVAAPTSALRFVARFIPQTASQFAMFGLACRSGLRADAPALALLVQPGSGVDRRHDWHVQLMNRDSSGKVTVLSNHVLTVPTVTYGRLVAPLWFRLETRGSLLEAAFSVDGAAWTSAGRSSSPAENRIGFIAASGIPEVATAVRFEIVSL